MPFFSFSINTAKTYKKTNKLKTAIKLTPGIIHQVNIYNWRGNRGTVHLIVEHEHHQIFPVGEGQDYHGDGLRIGFKDFYELKEGHAVLDVYTWNTSTKYSHEFIVSFGVLPKSVLLPMQHLFEEAGKVEELTAIVGIEGET